MNLKMVEGGVEHQTNEIAIPTISLGRKPCLRHENRDEDEKLVSTNHIVSPSLLAVAAVANRLDISTRSVWRLVSSGELPQPILVGKSRKWHPDEIEAYI